MMCLNMATTDRLVSWQLVKNEMVSLLLMHFASFSLHVRAESSDCQWLQDTDTRECDDTRKGTVSNRVCRRLLPGN